MSRPPNSPILATLTKAGRSLRNNAEATVTELQDEILAPLNAAERETLWGLLQRTADDSNDLSRVSLHRAS